MMLTVITVLICIGAEAFGMAADGLPAPQQIASAKNLAQANSHAKSESTQLPSTTKLAKQLNALIDLVLDKHIDPPTRQQMILSGTRAVFHTSRKRMPQETSRRSSKVSNEAELTDYLKTLQSQVEWKPEYNEVLFGGVVSSLPGGGRILSATEMKVEGQLNANRYVGTGIVLNVNHQHHRPAIPKAFYNGPAWKAGVNAGDLILEIDGTSTEKMSLGDVVKRLRGKRGSEVTIKVRQPDDKTIRTLKVTRDVAFIPTVEGYRQISEAKWQYTIDGAKQLAFVRINRIGSSTLHELRQVDRQLQAAGVRGVILDLRIGGGTLHDIIMIADALLEKGTIGRVRSGDEVKVHLSNQSTLFRKLSIAVLVDRTTSSGNEFLAAALKDNHRAIIVGTPTPGDGNVRCILEVPGGKFGVIFATGELQRADGTPLRALQQSAAAVTPIIRSKKANRQHRPGGVIPNQVITVTVQKRAELVRAYAITVPGLRKPVLDPMVDRAVKVLAESLKLARSKG